MMCCHQVGIASSSYSWCVLIVGNFSGCCLFKPIIWRRDRQVDWSRYINVTLHSARKQGKIVMMTCNQVLWHHLTQQKAAGWQSSHYYSFGWHLCIVPLWLLLLVWSLYPPLWLEFLVDFVLAETGVEYGRGLGAKNVLRLSQNFENKVRILGILRFVLFSKEKQVSVLAFMLFHSPNTISELYSMLLVNSVMQGLAVEPWIYSFRDLAFVNV